MDVWCFWGAAVLQLWFGFYLIRRNFHGKMSNDLLAAWNVYSISTPTWESDLVRE
ncbi:hypothetical protein J2857_003636 [Neorhizobium galegae]|nr:hypothetical protein [Neorhizobium galegae]